MSGKKKRPPKCPCCGSPFPKPCSGGHRGNNCKKCQAWQDEGPDWSEYEDE